jgi:hypothetical protein
MQVRLSINIMTYLLQMSKLQAAGLCPAERYCFQRGYAPGSAFGPICLLHANGEAEPRRTSGGKAATVRVNDFCAKPTTDN